MHYTAATPPFNPPRLERFDREAPILGLAIVTATSGLVAGARLEPRWLATIAVALGIFFALKFVSLRGVTRGARPSRVLAYLAFWPGMNAAAFLHGAPPARPAPGELTAALAKLAFGGALAAWAMRYAFVADARAVGWVGMLGVIFVFHFGFFHALSWAWRRAGVDAPRLMRMPIAARSLGEFWGERWNTAFSALARRFILRPLGRRWGVAPATGVVFLASGLIHELAISLPARGGWGGPTLYFLLQGASVAREKRVGRSSRWVTLLVTALPLPLLFHAPLVTRVVVPFFRFLKEVL